MTRAARPCVNGCRRGAVVALHIHPEDALLMPMHLEACEPCGLEIAQRVADNQPRTFLSITSLEWV